MPPVKVEMRLDLPPVKAEISTTEFNGELQEILNGKDDICFAFMGNVYRLIIVNHGDNIIYNSDDRGYPSTTISRRHIYMGKEPVSVYGMKELYLMHFYDFHTYRLCLIELIDVIETAVTKGWLEENPENYYA